MKFSVLVPFVPKRPEQVLPFAGIVRYTQADRLWQGQSMYVDSHHQYAVAAGAGLRVPVGIGVSLMPLRHPWEAAMQARSIAAVTGHSVVAGYGPGAKSFQQAMLGAPYPSPLTAAREYLTVTRQLLDGKTVTLDGDYFRCAAALPALPAPAVEVGLGVLRPKMAELAGEVADAAISWLTPANYLRDVIVPAVEKGAANAGREQPRVVAMTPIALSRKDREPAEIALSSNAAHFRVGHYIDMLRRSGIEITETDLITDARAAVDGGAFLSGDTGELVEKLALFEAAGVDEVVLNVTGVCNLYGPEVALRELESILSALH